MSEQLYIPYEATAEATVQGAETENVFKRIFPDASASQLEQARSHTVGVTHDGIEIGLACTEDNPMSTLEAYRFGYAEGYERAKQELRSGE